MRKEKMKFIRTMTLPLMIFSGTATLFAAANPNDFASPATVEKFELTDGVTAYQYTFDELYGDPQIVSVIKADLNNPAIETGIFACENKIRTTTSEMAGKANAIAATNFGYFNMKDPSSPAGALKKADGTIESTGSVGGDCTGYFSQTDGEITISPTPPDFNAVDMARAGFPTLVNGSEIYRKIGTYDHIPGKHNRTAIGITEDNILYLVVFDGRFKENAAGVSCYDLADFMQRLGCDAALNMDGGGSSTMYIKDKGILNYPSDNRKFDHEGERRVYDIFFIRAEGAGNSTAANDAE